MTIECKYPHIEINCDDVHGTTPGVVLAVTAALEREHVSEEEILEYQREAVSGDYYKALQASLRMVRFA